MRTVAIVLFVVAALSALSGLRNLIAGENRPEEGAVLGSYAVGSFLPAIAALVAALTLWGKAKRQ